MKTYSPGVTALAVLSAGILTLTGCTPEVTSPTTQAGSPVANTMVASAAPAASDAPAPSGGATMDLAQGVSVTIVVTDTNLTMPSALPHGSIGFKINNNGKSKHNLEFKGGDMDKKLDEAVDPGASQTVQLELKAGTYKVSDPDNPAISSTLEVK